MFAANVEEKMMKNKRREKKECAVAFLIETSLRKFNELSRF